MVSKQQVLGSEIVLQETYTVGLELPAYACGELIRRTAQMRI